MSSLVARSIKFIIMVSVLAALVLFKLDMEQLLQWEIITVVVLGTLFIFAYKWRKLLRLDKPYVQIQFVDA